MDQIEWRKKFKRFKVCIEYNTEDKTFSLCPFQSVSALASLVHESSSKYTRDSYEHRFYQIDDGKQSKTPNTKYIDKSSTHTIKHMNRTDTALGALHTMTMTCIEANTCARVHRHQNTHAHIEKQHVCVTKRQKNKYRNEVPPTKPYIFRVLFSTTKLRALNVFSFFVIPYQSYHESFDYSKSKIVTRKLCKHSVSEAFLIWKKIEISRILSTHNVTFRMTS